MAGPIWIMFLLSWLTLPSHISVEGVSGQVAFAWQKPISGDAILVRLSGESHHSRQIVKVDYVTLASIGEPCPHDSRTLAGIAALYSTCALQNQRAFVERPSSRAPILAFSACEFRTGGEAILGYVREEVPG